MHIAERILIYKFRKSLIIFIIGLNGILVAQNNVEFILKNNQ